MLITTETIYYPRTDGNLYSWFSKSTSNQEADTQLPPHCRVKIAFSFRWSFIFSSINEPRECKLIRYCIWDARMCGHIGSVLNSVIGNRYYASLVKGGKPALGVEKKDWGKGDRRVCGSFLAVAFPRSVIEGVSSRSENRGALLASTDLKMYPRLCLFRFFSWKIVRAISCSNSTSTFILPPFFLFSV